jgi:hypothetical protein
VTVPGSLAGESAATCWAAATACGCGPAGWAAAGENRWAAAEAVLAGRGGRAVAAARFVAVVHALVPVLAGTLSMSYRRLVCPIPEM